MKKISIDRLKKKGWEIPVDFQDKQESKKLAGQLNQTAESISRSVEKIAQAAGSLKPGDNGNAQLIKEQVDILKKLSENELARQWTKVVFDVKRNKSGTIDKVFCEKVK
jgi:hypothetical protein